MDNGKIDNGSWIIEFGYQTMGTGKKVKESELMEIDN